MLVGQKVIYLKEIDSTNNYLKQNFETGLVVYAGVQTSGRGQRTNTWVSNLEQNILLSFGYKPSGLNADKQFFLSMAVSLAVFDFLSEYVTDVKIKWPNDIYAGNKKIAGILIENVLKSGSILSSIIGVGININQTEFPESLPNPVSLKLISNKEYRIEELVNYLIVNINKRLIDLEKKQFYTLKKEYLHNLYKYQKESFFVVNNQQFLAKIIDVENSGLLVLEFPEKRVKSFAFKEIKFIIR